MSLQSLNTSFGLIIPEFDVFVVSCRDEIGFVCGMIIIDVIDSFVMGFEGVISCGRAERPDFDGTVKTGGCERVGVFGIDG